MLAAQIFNATAITKALDLHDPYEAVCSIIGFTDGGAHRLQGIHSVTRSHAVEQAAFMNLVRFAALQTKEYRSTGQVNQHDTQLLP